jgi:hypothetical protein
MKYLHLLCHWKISQHYRPLQRPLLPPLLHNSVLASLLILLSRQLVCQLPLPLPLLLSLPLNTPSHPLVPENSASTTLFVCSARNALEFFAHTAGTSTSAKIVVAAAYVSTKSSEFIA